MTSNRGYTVVFLAALQTLLHYAQGENTSRDSYIGMVSRDSQPVLLFCKSIMSSIDNAAFLYTVPFETPLLLLLLLLPSGRMIPL